LWAENGAQLRAWRSLRSATRVGDRLVRTPRLISQMRATGIAWRTLVHARAVSRADAKALRRGGMMWADRTLGSSWAHWRTELGGAREALLVCWRLAHAGVGRAFEAWRGEWAISRTQAAARRAGALMNTGGALGVWFDAARKLQVDVEQLGNSMEKWVVGTLGNSWQDWADEAARQRAARRAFGSMRAREEAKAMRAWQYALNRERLYLEAALGVFAAEQRQAFETWRDTTEYHRKFLQAQHQAAVSVFAAEVKCAFGLMQAAVEGERRYLQASVAVFAAEANMAFKLWRRQTLKRLSRAQRADLSFLFSTLRGSFFLVGR